MSTPMDTAGKGRAQSTSLWLWVLVVSLLVFAGNTGYALYKTARFGGANTAASNLQVNSQKLANQSREAVNGDAAAFKAVRATKAQIEADVKLLNDRFGSAMDVSGPIGAATATWVPMGKSADQILASESAVLALAGNAKNFTDRVPQLQAQLDEMGRAMSSTGSAPSQVFMAVRQSVLAASMAKSVAEMRAGGTGASVAGERLVRDAGVFAQVLNGLREGDQAMGVQKLTNATALATLNQATTLWVEMKKDLDAIVESSDKLFRAQTAATDLTTGSNRLLDDSVKLFSAFTAFSSSGEGSNMFGIGSLPISVISGLLAAISILFLVVSLNRAQRRRYESSMELNNRNQEAIMRLLDEMGSLAEGDLTVKATVTEDMTGARPSRSTPPPTASTKSRPRSTRCRATPPNRRTWRSAPWKSRPRAPASCARRSSAWTRSVARSRKPRSESSDWAKAPRKSARSWNSSTTFRNRRTSSR